MDWSLHVSRANNQLPLLSVLFIICLVGAFLFFMVAVFTSRGDSWEPFWQSDYLRLSCILLGSATVLLGMPILYCRQVLGYPSHFLGYGLVLTFGLALLWLAHHTQRSARRRRR